MKLSVAQRVIAAAERDPILGIYSGGSLGGIAHFSGIDIGRLEWLITEGHADPNERQNDAPSTAEFYKFLVAHPRFTVHGYAVDPRRDDYRLTIEGVELRAKPSPAERTAFDKRFGEADERVVGEDRLYCWYD